MYLRFIAPLIAVLYFFPFQTTHAAVSCIQVLQYAENNDTGECQAFPTPCDVPSDWTPVKECQIKTGGEVITPKFEVQKFASCEDMEKKLLSMMKRYQSNYWYPYGVMYENTALLESVPSRGVALSDKAVSAPVPVASPSGSADSSKNLGPVSTTNIQVLGVDEADNVKTDGTNIYTYSEESREVRIVNASTLTLVSKISVPKDWTSVMLYVSRDRLVLVGSKYVYAISSWNYRWYPPETKSIVAVYNISRADKPVLERYSQIDGSYRESRLIGDTLYLVSSSSLRMPPIYMTQYAKSANGFDQALSVLDKNFTLKNIAPEIRENIRNNKGRITQSIRSSIANCKDVTFVLPDEKTLMHVDFTPTFVSLSSVKISDPTSRMKSELLFGDVSQIHMSESALYVTSAVTMNQASPVSPCPRGVACDVVPNYGGVSKTLIHKYALKNGGLEYSYSTTVEGNPMNQYSMDEDSSGNFRIVTQNYAWSSAENKNSTEVNIIGPTGKILGSLKNIAPGETFQSARFIGKRLYLVTFEQIDPFFVIDLSNQANPRILGELKMPGYSTYLHPYDDDRLIGLGYDTKSNQWGGTQNAGIKVDLYNVRDVYNPIQEYSLVLGDIGSSSEVLSNPRAFVWYKEKKILLLPATLMKSANDKNDIYRYQSAFQGLIGLSINPGSVIEKFRVTHIVPDATLEKKWKDECAQYSGTVSSCKTLLDGSTYCGGGTTWVPPYCYAGSTVDTYLASNLWNYSRDFVTRALYIDETFYSLSEGGIKSWDFSSPTKVKNSVIFEAKPVKTPIYPVPLMAK